MTVSFSLKLCRAVISVVTRLNENFILLVQSKKGARGSVLESVWAAVCCPGGGLPERTAARSGRKVTEQVKWWGPKQGRCGICGEDMGHPGISVFPWQSWAFCPEFLRSLACHGGWGRGSYSFGKYRKQRFAF
jgi:hypothetical protein